MTSSRDGLSYEKWLFIEQMSMKAVPHSIIQWYPFVVCVKTFKVLLFKYVRRMWCFFVALRAAGVQ